MVIVGGGLAGATAAETLRDEGFDGTVQVVGAEQHLPYLRPPLSKEYFTGKAERDSIFVHPAEWYAERDIDLLLEAGATSLDLSAHILTLADDQVLPYDRLVLATGSSPRRSDAPGSDASGIHYLRTVDDSESLRKALQPGDKRVVVVGAGWIGLEVASAARGYGNEVTLVGRDAIPLQGPLGDELGAVFQSLHEANGVTFLLGRSVTSADADGGRLTGVVTDHGEAVQADVVVVGMGATPNVDLAARAGLLVDNGMLVDEHLASSDPDVFGAGDLANAIHPVIKQRMRNEHWANALGTGKVAAKSLLGQDVVFDEIPYFYTDQFDLGMEYSGYPPLARGASVVIRGDKAAREFISFWIADGKVVAGMNVNIWDVNDDVQAIIRSGRVVDLARLADPSADLKSLLA
ncbi:MAG TPA: FAD-dependent oxidoreductase [Galbitalea sp.]|nr:FAD-dependent oxidoreductase [Galbitalea sp.]